MEMLKDIWNIRSLNENFMTHTLMILLLKWYIQNLLKTQFFNQEKLGHCSLGPKIFMLFRCSNTKHISEQKASRHFSWQYTHLPLYKVQLLLYPFWYPNTRRWGNHKGFYLCLKKGSQSLDYLYSSIDLYIALNQQKNSPKRQISM